MADATPPRAAQSGSHNSPPPASLLHLSAPLAQLPPRQPKPTSSTGQTESALEVWESTTNASVGLWECEPGEFTAVRDDYAEVCQILSGSASVHGDDGISTEVSAGSLLILPLGWRGRWIVRETIRKTYVLLPAAPQA